MGEALNGKAALVTGSSRRIGKAIAMQLARAGASVAINARTSREEAQAVVDEIRAMGGRAMLALADVTDPAATKTMCDAIAAEFGSLDIVVHNAVVREHSPIELLELETWRQTLSVVLDGAFLCAKHAVPHMARSGGGSILFIGGASAFVGSTGPAIPTAKSGLVGLTRSLAVALGPKGIRVNLLSPGRIEAQEDDPLRSATVAKSRPDEAIPLRRAGTLDDVARSACSLVGPDFAYLTGQTVHLAGGLVMQ